MFLQLVFISLTAQTDLESLAKRERASGMRFTDAYGKRTSDERVDITHVSLAMEPDMNTGAIRKASALFTFVPGADITELDFDLRKELQVDSVLFDGRQLNFTHSNAHILLLDFASLLEAGRSYNVQIYYSGQPNMGSRAYFRVVNASGPVISTLSQPYGASYWWPCRDNLVDKLDSLDVQLRVDTPFTAVSNGVLKEVRQEGGKRLFRFAHRYPVATYLVAVTFSRYNSYTQSAFLGSLGKNLNIVNYVFPHGNQNSLRLQSAETAGIMHLFDSLFGSYPFHREQYGHAQFAWGGGMEHQTMSFMVNFSYDLIAHELAHQWFGDMVTCGSWKDIWLNEGFATYANLLCYNTPARDDEWIALLKKYQDEVMALPGGSVHAYDTGSVSAMFDYRTTYQKGAMVLHQLRWLIGDSAFFGAIHAYLSEPTLAYGFARQKDLQHYMEKHSGMDLSDYFNDWIMGEGYPQFSIRWTQKGKQLHLDISQQPSHASVDVFNVPLPIWVRGKNKDTMLRVNIGQLQEFYRTELDFKVDNIVFDPREHLLAKAEVFFPVGESGAISIFPNPFNGRFYVSLSEAEIGSWAIYDMCGKLVEEKNLSGYTAPGSILEIPAEVLAPGIYTLKINTSYGAILRKIIKTS